MSILTTLIWSWTSIQLRVGGIANFSRVHAKEDNFINVIIFFNDETKKIINF